MAVYTEIDKYYLDDLLKNYDIGKCECLHPISDGISNSNYKLSTNKNEYLLTIIEDKNTDDEDIKFVVDILQKLKEQKIPTPAPIIDKSDSIIHKYKNKPLIITEFLQGQHIKNSQDFDATDIVGELIAKIHITTDSIKYIRKNPRPITNLIANIDKYTNYADKFQTGWGGKIINIAQNIISNWQDNLPSGIIHADLFPDNILFNNNKKQISGVIDFYMAGHDIFAYDLAICINAWCFAGNEIDIAKTKKMLDAYQKIRPLTNAEKVIFQTIMQAAAIRFLLSRLYEWFNLPKDALVTPHNPQEYMDKLDYHIKNNIIEQIYETS